MSNNVDTKSVSSYDYLYKNKRTIIMVVGVLLIIIALIGFIMISGVQTGSSDNIGVSGSIVRSSTGGSEDGEINPTTEVVAEFFCICFLIFGVAMVVYVGVNNKIQEKLFKSGKTFYAALLVSGKKEIPKSAEDAALAADVQKSAEEIGKITGVAPVPNIPNMPMNTVYNQAPQVPQSPSTMYQTMMYPQGLQAPQSLQPSSVIPMNNYSQAPQSFDSNLPSSASSLPTNVNMECIKQCTGTNNFKQTIS